MIETRLLRQFIAVAEELHFHKAALRLHMAQPALSQAINRLEDKLGFALLARDRRGVQLLPAGAAFVQTAYSVLGQLQHGVEHARQVSQGIAGTLTVTSVSIAGYPWLLDTLKQFRLAFPKVRLVIKEMPSARQAKALLDGDADIAFLRYLPGQADNLESRLLLDEPILMALPCDHPHAGDAAVELRDFADTDFVFTPQVLGSGYHQQLIALCEAAGFYPRVVQEADQLHTLIGLVACGFGVALVPESIARSISSDKVVFLPLTAASSSIGLYLNWRTDNSSPLPAHFFCVLEGVL
ncbi:LysR family transcriptional regulator [Pseudomonas sp. Bout1]|uniref:LysR family transcriptional regulator n=1 Tax=Pseudomonas sp. Bout1 TaxID=3048600 RepID=UPI002AB3ABCB|nr:LysR family transcriptional regulator [Pseudomonas sp. Bout1]MDY7532906.1 LysR family transcriptional regulator [Pseudomonas sp. Bout1]MEB0188571.1 LysR family transcriptional regulator [Pseudomonas sp. Bout1]